MINFQKIKWKNFLATGNAFTEIRLDDAPTKLIFGKNGHGKSTVLDAITFALFNKPFRNISKPQLVNSVNGKKALVEIEFSIGKKDYLIRRGINPNVFDIVIDGEKLDQNANVRDFQKHLEENILKLNYKSFTQIVILGSATFTPFMQLTTAVRREIIEDLLDIRIFTAMKDVLKQKTTIIKERLVEVDADLRRVGEVMEVTNKYIDVLKTDKTEKADRITSEIETLKKSSKETFKEMNALIEEKDEIGDVAGEKRKLETYKNEVTFKINQLKKQITFYESNSECPTCKQPIDEDFKKDVCDEHNGKLTTMQAGSEGINKKLDEINDAHKKYVGLSEQTGELQTILRTNKTLLDRLENELKEVEKLSGNIEEEEAKAASLVEEIAAHQALKDELTEEQHYNTAIESLLKDSGIKTKIIRQYLPVINKLVNKYLAAMDFYVNFELDETFKETIKSRHRDKFTYASFSEGQKQRIDLALLFTWRDIAKLKNSASTNLLMLDEIFDSSLDDDGVDIVKKLIHKVSEDNNVFVITPKPDDLFDMFKEVIEFRLNGNYSQKV
jgi:DNA repair exonuclease SbcCD ATPase subunit